MTTKFAGKEGFAWFFGVVEDRDSDPLQIGRPKVRIHHWHTADQSVLPTDQLVYCGVIQPVTSAALGGVGKSPTGIAVGSTVFGFFADGEEGQMPMIMGTLAGVPDDNDVHPLARGTNTVVINQVGPEPAQPYAAKYPYNKVEVTEGGHVFEVDDTPSNERIRQYHKSGTYTEIDAKGQRVDKIIGDAFEIDVANKTLYVGGNFTAQIKGNASLEVDGNVTANVGGNMDTVVKGAATFDATSLEVKCLTTFDKLVSFKSGFNLTGTGGGDGNININGDVVGAGHSLANHIHGGVQQGGGKTSAPIG